MKGWVEVKTKRFIISTIIVTILINISFFYLNVIIKKHYIDYSQAHYGNWLLYIPGSLSGSIACILICKIIKTNIILEYIGLNSLYFYAFHYMIIGIVEIALKLLRLPILISISLKILIILLITTIVVEIYKYCYKRVSSIWMI